MTVETRVDIQLRAEDYASNVVRGLKRQVDALNKSLASLAKVKLPDITAGAAPGLAAQAAAALQVQARVMAGTRAQISAERQAARQRAADTKAEERQHRVYEANVVRTFRQNMRFTQAMARQRITLDRQVAREAERTAASAEREEASALRRKISGDNWRFRLRERMDRQERADRDRVRRQTLGRVRDVQRYGRDAGHEARDTVRPVGLVGLAAGAATAAATKRILSSEIDVDAAEIRARTYGGLSAEAARALRNDWAAPIGETLGAETAKLLTAWTDAVKLGIPNAGAKGFAELATQTSEAWEIPFEAVTDIMGTVNSLLTSNGKAFSLDRLKSVSNTVQHLAAKQSTTPEKLVSFLQRGAGAAQLLGMSQEAGLAFGSASTSLGNRAGESGTLFDYIASRVIEMPKLVQQKGQEGEQAKDLMRVLGYGSADAMDRKRRADPDAFLPDLFERFAKIRDPRKQNQSVRFFTGREWIGEAGRIIKGMDTYREAVRLSREAKGLDAIGDVWRLHQLKLRFVFKQFRAGWLNILGEFGKEFSPLARQVGDYFLAWSQRLRNGGLQARVKALLEGFVAGLGFKDVGALLRGVFGEPGRTGLGDIEAWRAAARGFGQGLRDVGDMLKAIFSTFTGGSSDPEVIGRWTARILGFSAALVIASPAISLLTALAAGILAVASAVSVAGKILGGLGLLGGRAAAGATAGAAVGLSGIWATAGHLIALGFLAKIAADWGVLKMPSPAKGIGRGILEFLDPGIASRIYGNDPPARVQRQSYHDEGHNGAFISKASLTSDEIVAGLDRLGRSIAGRLAPGVQLAALGAASTAGSFGGGGSVPGFPGAGGGAGAGAGARHPAVPSWYGRGSNPGGAEASSAPGRGSANHMHGQYGAPGSNLTTITTASGRKVTVHKAAAENFRGFLNELEASGYKINSLGGHNHRSIRGSNRLSQHAYGNAIDVNPAQNPMGPNLVTDLPKNVSDMAAKWGLTWGGDWKRRPDAMHFEWNGKTLDQLKREGPGAVASGDRSTAGGLTGVIERAAAAAGIDPRIMHGIRAGESGHRADYDRNITPREESYGPFQLNRKGGLGTVFERETGLDLKDPSTIPQQAAWVAQHVRKKLAVNPRYNPGSEWFGYKGLRQSDPSWGNAGLVSDPEADRGFVSTGWRRPGEVLSKPRADMGMKNPNAAAILRPKVDPNMALSPRDAVKNLPARLPSPSEAAGAVPPMRQLQPWTRQDGGAGGQGGGGPGSSSAPTTVNVTNHITAGNQSPQEMASHIQRHVTEAWNYRSHDLEPELT